MIKILISIIVIIILSAIYFTLHLIERKLNDK